MIGHNQMVRKDAVALAVINRLHAERVEIRLGTGQPGITAEPDPDPNGAVLESAPESERWDTMAGHDTRIKREVMLERLQKGGYIRYEEHSGERVQMSRAPPRMRDFAECLIAYETRGNKSSEAKTPVVFACEKLRPQLVTLMGNTGFRALLSRALALASAEVPWLRAVRVKADASLEGSEELHAQVAPEDIVEGGVVLLAQLLGLLATFIGENLTVHLVREVWPNVPLNDLDFDAGGKK
jgi:hypothetical protein